MSAPEYLYSELPALQLFQQLGYSYYCAKDKDERNNITEVILAERLKAAIKRINGWIDDNNLQKAFDDITTVSGSYLMEINEKVWDLIRGTKLTLKQTINGTDAFLPVAYIDYTNIENNDFLVVNQMRYHGRLQNSVPDI